jgi:hypothetical protein
MEYVCSAINALNNNISDEEQLNSIQMDADMCLCEGKGSLYNEKRDP